MTLPTPRRACALLALTAAPVALAAAAPGSTAAAGRAVVIEDFAFKPSALSVSRGTTVTWRFSDGATRHNVVSVGTRRFTGSALKATGTHRVTFRKAGTYRYVCSVHPGMKGTVRVR